MKKISIMLILVLLHGGCKVTTPHEMAYKAGKKVVKKTMDSTDDSSSDDSQSDSK